MATVQPGRSMNTIAGATIAAVLLALIAGPLLRFHILDWHMGLGLFAVAALLAGLGGLACLFGLLRRPRVFGLIIAVAGLATIALPAIILLPARDLPLIHDISTDSANPPHFTAITAAVRGADADSTDYDPANAPLQAAAYPEIAPLVLPMALRPTFRRALVAAVSLNWAIVASDPVSGRIEATATMPWWGFKQDIVVRLTAQGSGTRVDVRSVSRVGSGDFGINARHVADFMSRMH